jgi:hypothetical protein
MQQRACVLRRGCSISHPGFDPPRREEGEIGEEEAAKKRRRVKLQAFGRPAHVKDYSSLPQGLRTLIEESFSMHDRIIQLDRAMSVARDPDMPAEHTANPVPSMLQRVCPSSANSYKLTSRKGPRPGLFTPPHPSSVRSQRSSDARKDLAGLAKIPI